MWTGEKVLIALEVVAVVLNLAFTALIAYQKRSGWLYGCLAAVISIGLYAITHTWALCALNVYYMVMAVYGWWAWGRNDEELPVRRASWRIQVPLVIGSTSVALLLGWTLRVYLNGAYPMVDAFVSVFSVAATWLMTRKYLDNWLWFIVADAVGIWLNWRIGYTFYSAQYAVYIALSIAGFMRWRRTMLPLR